MDTNPLRLTIHRGPDTEPRRIAFDGERVSVGRSDQCDIRLPFRVVSSHHLTFERRGSEYFVCDESSTNGTQLDETMLTAGEWYELDDGTRLQVVDVFIDIELPHDQPDETLGGFTLEQTGTLARELLGDALADDGDELAYFEILKGPGTGRRFEVPDDADGFDIGGAEECSVTLPGSNLPDRAAVVDFQGHAFQLRPLETSLVRLDDRDLGSPVVLRDGNRVSVADIVMSFRDPLQAELEELAELDRLEGGAVGHEESGERHVDGGGGEDYQSPPSKEKKDRLEEQDETENGSSPKKRPGKIPGKNQTRPRRWLDALLLLATILAVIVAVVVMLVTFGLI